MPAVTGSMTAASRPASGWRAACTGHSIKIYYPLQGVGYAHEKPPLEEQNVLPSVELRVTAMGRNCFGQF